MKKRIRKSISYILMIGILSLILGLGQGVVRAEETQSIELSVENLSNAANYQYGWYQSWGGAYKESTGSICSVKYYRVDKPVYHIYTNDSRIRIAIAEFDSTGKWLKHTDDHKNGGQFVKQEATAYIHLTVKSVKWGVNLFTLLESGLKIEFTDEEKSSSLSLATVDIGNADFSNAQNWVAGSISYQTGEYMIDPARIMFSSYCTVDNADYVVRLPGGYLKMNILELDANGATVANYDIHNGQKWKKNPNTEKIALSVFTTGMGRSYTLEEYKALIASYPEFGLRPYVSYYKPDTMDNLSATEFINRMNVGWNLGNSFDSKCDRKSRGYDANPKQELNWGNPYVTKELIDYVASCGFNTIRIPVSWYYNTGVDENGRLRVGKQWLARVKEVVDYAMANNMYVILNSHHDQPIFYAGTSDENMQQVLAAAKSLWTDVAAYFRDYDEHLIFESFNEIDNVARSWNYSDLAAEQMNVMNQVFVNAVRATGGNNATRILMVPTLLDGTASNVLNAFRMPADTVADRIVVQVHTYTKRFDRSIEPPFARLEAFSMRIGAPIVIGECGTTNTYPLPALRDENASNFVARAAAHGIKCIWWDNGSDFKIIDRRNFANSDVQLIQALMNGTQGLGYQVNGEMILNNIDQFVLRMPNLKTGVLEQQYWGTLTTNVAGGAISVPAKKNGMVTLKAENGATDVWLQRILFYDATGNYICGKELQSTEYVFDIPAGAAYMHVSMNSPTRTITYEQYGVYVNGGDIELSISFFDEGDVVPVIVSK